MKINEEHENNKIYGCIPVQGRFMYTHIYIYILN